MSSLLPGAVHDLTAARIWGIPGALAAAGLATLADKGHMLATSIIGDVATALREHGSATLDERCCYFRRPD